MADPNTLLAPVIRKVFQPDAEYQAFGAELSARELPDYIFATEEMEQDPTVIFRQLRWGGQYVFASPLPQKVREVSQRFADYGFTIEQPADPVHDGWQLWPFVRKKDPLLRRPKDAARAQGRPH